MAYPVKGAGYERKPAWLDRAKEGEGHSNVPFRQDGGPLPPTTSTSAPWLRGTSTTQTDMDNAVSDHLNNMKFTQGPLSAAAKSVRNPLPSGWDDSK